MAVFDSLVFQCVVGKSQGKCHSNKGINFFSQGYKYCKFLTEKSTRQTTKQEKLRKPKEP